MKRTEPEKAYIGEKIAAAFDLKWNKKTERYRTGYGDKTCIGVFNMFEAIAEKLAQGDEKGI